MTPEQIKAAVARIREAQDTAREGVTISDDRGFTASLALLIEVAEKVAEAPIISPYLADDGNYFTIEVARVRETLPVSYVGLRVALVRLTDNTENSNDR